MSSLPCSVCLDPIIESDDNQILKCNDCGVCVHMLCYGIEIFEKDWKCSPCGSNKADPICSICIQTGGAMKKTVCRKWVHVICALFTEGVTFMDSNDMEPVEIAYISKTKRNQTCIFCQNNTGFCSLCYTKKCKNRLHITCAQRSKCLREELDKKNNIKFRAYCHVHKPEDASRRISAQFVRGRVLKAKKEQRNHKEQSNQINANWITKATVGKRSRSLSCDSQALVVPVENPKKDKRIRKDKNKEIEKENEKLMRSTSATESDVISIYADTEIDEFLNKKPSTIPEQADKLKMWWDTRDLRVENQRWLGDEVEIDYPEKENINTEGHICFKDDKIFKVGIISKSKFLYFVSVTLFEALFKISCIHWKYLKI